MRREHSHCPQFVIMEAHIGEMDHTGNGPARERSRAGMKGEFPKSGVTRHRAGWWNMQTQGRQPGFKAWDHWLTVLEYIIQPPPYFSF